MEKQVIKLNHKKNLALTLVFCLQAIFSVLTLNAQDSTRNYLPLDYNKPKEYTIVSIETKGNKYIDKNIIIFNTGLSFNQRIKVPGNEISQAIENLWKQGYFSFVSVYAKKIVDGKIYLIIEVQERPRLARFGIRGIGKSEAKTLREELSVKAGMVINEDMLNKLRREIKSHYYKKGFYGVKIDFKQEADTTPNKDILRIAIDKGKKVKVYDIEFVGNTDVADQDLRRSLKKTKRQRKKINVFSSSKFVEDTYKEELKSVITKYNSKGYRDASISFDSVVRISPNKVVIKIGVNEGRKYYFRNISFTGNNKYSSSDLGKVLGIKKGDIYDQTVLDERLYFSPNGTDISSLYMDDG